MLLFFHSCIPYSLPWTRHSEDPESDRHELHLFILSRLRAEPRPLLFCPVRRSPAPRKLALGWTAEFSKLRRPRTVLRSRGSVPKKKEGGKGMLDAIAEAERGRRRSRCVHSSRALRWGFAGLCASSRASRSLVPRSHCPRVFECIRHGDTIGRRAGEERGSFIFSSRVPCLMPGCRRSYVPLGCAGKMGKGRGWLLLQRRNFWISESFSRRADACTRTMPSVTLPIVAA